MTEVLKIKGQEVFDNKQGELSEKTRKLIQENKELFQLQFDTHKSEIVRNLDKANKKLLGNMYKSDTEVKTEMDRLEKDIQEDPQINTYYQNFLKRINKIKNPERKQERKLMGLMQLASMKCITVMNAEVQKKWKRGTTIAEVLSHSFYKVKNSGVDGIMGPNTTSVFMDILSRDNTLPQFDGTISKVLIKKIYDECHVAVPPTKPDSPTKPDNPVYPTPEQKEDNTSNDSIFQELENKKTEYEARLSNRYALAPAQQTEIKATYAELLAQPDKSKRQAVIKDITDGAILAGLNDVLVAKILKSPADKKAVYQDIAQDIVERQNQMITNNTPVNTPVNNPDQSAANLETMTKSLDETFAGIKKILQLNAKINGITYTDFAFAETTDGTKITKGIAYKGKSIVNIGIDNHESKSMFFATYEVKGQAKTERSATEFSKEDML